MNFKFVAPLIAIASSAMLQAQQPDANTILEGARMAVVLNKLDEGITGNLTQGRRSFPVGLFLKGEDIQFQYAENNLWNVFHMHLGEDFRLFRIVGGKTTPFPPDQLVQPIAGTDLTYEDLALRFFYWPNPVLEGVENVNGEQCYRLRLQKPRGAPGRYETVYLWVHTKFGAFMRIRGHDARGGLVKEFQVQNVMQVAPGVWTLRRMQVATHDPATGRRVSISDVSFNPPKRVGPRGVR
jgi:hypothetical protein